MSGPRAKMPQVLNFGSKHRENMPAPARGSSQSSRARKTSKLSHFTIPWYQIDILFYTFSYSIALQRYEYLCAAYTIGCRHTFMIVE